MPNLLGLDLGGTKIALVKYEADSFEKLEELKVDTVSDKGSEGLVKQLKELIEKHQNKETVAVGIGVPGPTIGGVIEKLPNIEGVEKLDLKSELEGALNLPVRVENDANCFVVGAWKQSEHKDKQNVIGMTLGTGIGGAIILDGHLVRGRNGAAGEFGHMVFNHGGVEVNHMDIAEFLFSGTGLKNRWQKEHDEEKSGEDIVAAAEAGDEQAVSFLTKVGEDFGMMVSNLVLAFNPEAILVGGSAAAAFPFYEGAMRKLLKEAAFLSAADIPVERVEGADYAPFGAAWLAQQN